VSEATIMTFVVIPHAREPWDEATLWIVSGECSAGTVRAIAYETPPSQAVKVFGPAKHSVVKEMTEALSLALSNAGIAADTVIQPDD